MTIDNPTSAAIVGLWRGDGGIAVKFGTLRAAAICGAGMFALISAMLIFTSIPAIATTYNYVGSPYTSNDNPAEFGSNMTGTVTFNFDTTGVSGTFDIPGGTITNLQLTSGIYTSTFFSFSDYFVLVNGAITEWNIFNETQTSPDVELEAFKISPFTNVFDEVVRFPGDTDFGATAFIEYTFSGGTGVWAVADTPLPAALPLFATGLGALGLLARRRKRKNATTV